MLRLFVGIALSPPIISELQLLRSNIKGARWIEPENIHLTLRFIGEVSPEIAEEIDLALSKIVLPTFMLRLESVGTFGQGRKTHSLWAGVGASEELFQLRNKTETTMLNLGLSPDSRKYTPHVTLAKLKDVPNWQLGDFLSTHAIFKSQVFKPSEFALFSSHLGKSGANYQIEARYPLKGNDQ